MKTNILMISVILLAPIVPSFANEAGESLPTIEEIDSEIARIANTNSAKIAWRHLVPMVQRINNLQRTTETQDVLRVQWHVVSNLFEGCHTDPVVTNMNQVDYLGLRMNVPKVTHFRLFFDQISALMFVADHVSNAVPVDVSREDSVIEADMRCEQIPEFGSTNSLTGIKVVCSYHSITNRDRLFRPWESAWRNKHGFNTNVNDFRDCVFEEFGSLIMKMLVEYPEPVRRDLWDEFCRRAGASAEEKSRAESRLYWWVRDF